MVPVERMMLMGRSLQDKLATLDPGRRAQIEAETDRLQEEYLNTQQPSKRQREERDDTDSEKG
ncbi:hypothetical protein BG36_02250 [Aquamicrobium defluvii]|jgi:hypothetical protein|uniref:Uncharacterized protein n=2 Tax=Aquamicrobium defluvii TaxID=69279 RepID=A0A011VKQ4_9HYPH|nr:hypothetical protein BG36_02250 [Aquamicrobium defluvii]